MPRVVVWAAAPPAIRKEPAATARLRCMDCLTTISPLELSSFSMRAAAIDALDALRTLAAPRAVGPLRTVGAAAAAIALEVRPRAIAAIVGSRAAAPVAGVARRARLHA